MYNHYFAKLEHSITMNTAIHSYTLILYKAILQLPLHLILFTLWQEVTEAVQLLSYRCTTHLILAIQYIRTLFTSKTPPPLTVHLPKTETSSHASVHTAWGGDLKRYRFGFNGQEKDDEVTGVTGSHLNFKFRMYDSRIARFFAVDPLAPSYPELTPYQFASNTPIWAEELEGLEANYTNEGSTQSTSTDGGPTNTVSGPITSGFANDLGYTEAGVNMNVPDYSFSDDEVQSFSDWNAQSGPTEPGACIGNATTGSEILTGADAGFRNSKGKNVFYPNGVKKGLADLGANLVKSGHATALPIKQGQETSTILKNPNAQNTANTAYISGPAGAYHSLIIINNTKGKEFSIFDQGTGWDVKNENQQGAQEQIDHINSYYPKWGSLLWQIHKSKTVEKRSPIK